MDIQTENTGLSDLGLKSSSLTFNVLVFKISFQYILAKRENILKTDIKKSQISMKRNNLCPNLTSLPPQYNLAAADRTTTECVVAFTEILMNRAVWEKLKTNFN